MQSAPHVSHENETERGSLVGGDCEVSCVTTVGDTGSDDFIEVWYMDWRSSSAMLVDGGRAVFEGTAG